MAEDKASEGDMEKGQASTTVPEKPKFVGWPKFSIWRRLYFFDVDRLVFHGFRTRLEPEDMWQEKSVATARLVEIFEPAMEEQKARQVVQAAQLKAELQILEDKMARKAGKNRTASSYSDIPVIDDGKSSIKAPTVGLVLSDEELKPKASVSPLSELAGGKAAVDSKGSLSAEKQQKDGPPAEKQQKLPKLPRDEQRRLKLEKRLDRATNSVDLRRVVLAGNVGSLVGSGFLYLLSQACQLAGPLLLQRIVAGLQCQGFPGCEPKSQLYYYCIGLFMAPFIQAMSENHQNYILYLTGTRMRNALMAAIYRKCLRLSNSSLQEESTGRVVTLMSNDAQKLQDAMMAIHAMWGSPCFIIAVLALLWQQVGWATLVGLAVMLCLGPASGKLATKLGSLRKAMLQWTDKRVGHMSEIISGIQMIKFYAWERPFEDKVQSARSQEARIMRLTAAWQGLFAMLLFMGPVLVAIFCFGSWTLAGNRLTNANGYAALALFGLLRFPLSFLPMLITMVVNAMVALKRIGNFLSKEESALIKEVLDDNYPVGEVLIEKGEFCWDMSDPKSTISNINMQAKPGTLTMIVGGVGSGKSSVLGALVGHMTKRAGRVKVGGRVAYVAQQAWIMNDTLQENVLLGDENMDTERYKMSLKVSCLGPDLEILPNGDVTEIGDRGVTLSGGQKQRVSIARAVYSNADVYILDDPLSAVDSHVGRALFENCIRGVLRDKTVVLVTNALQYLPQADNVLWMEDGVIRAQGTYAQLVAQGLNIAELEHEDEEDEVADKPQELGAKPSAGPGAVQVQTEGRRRGSKEGRTSRDGPGPGRVSKDFGAKGGQASGKVTLTRGAATANRNLTGVEEREAGNLSGDVIKTYLSAGGGVPVVLAIIALFAVEQGARVYTDRWVGIWFSDVYDQSLGFYLGIYFALGITYGMVTYGRSLRFLFMCVNAAVGLHNQLLGHLLILPKTFFDTNPTGRILNRFSRDTDIMDTTLPASMIQFCGCVATYISILITISIATKWFAIALPFLTIIYFYVQRFYIPTARELQRIESICRSPIYSRFAEALQGVCTIRAYRKEGHFTKMSDGLMETNANAFMTMKLAAAWLAMRLDMFGLAVITGCGVLVIAGNVDPALAGLALMYALDLTRYLKQGTNMASKAESDFNSAERIIQYLRPEPEAASDTAPEVLETMPAQWPNVGTLEVEDLTMRYRPEMPLVLRGITFTVQGGEKVGLVGRTGSGKSSIFMALFRMVEPTSGRVLIDGVDTRTLGVRHLRSQMSIIPQDPFMFSGTVRTNLDPFSQNDDARLWEVIEAVGLKQAITNMNGALGARVVDNGANFSLGQRQLFCMARAMLRDSKLLMLDEATASVDVDTDVLIQYAIRTVFASCTLLTIAHRLNTIMDSDKVIVLEAGKVVECAHADDLLKHDNGIFTGMVGQTGKSSARYLRSLASSARNSQRSGIRQLPSMKGMSFNSGKSFNVQSFNARSLNATSFNATSFNAKSIAETPSSASPSRLAAQPAPFLLDEDGSTGDGSEDRASTGSKATGSTDLNVNVADPEISTVSSSPGASSHARAAANVGISADSNSDTPTSQASAGESSRPRGGA